MLRRRAIFTESRYKLSIFFAQTFWNGRYMLFYAAIFGVDFIEHMVFFPCAGVLLVGSIVHGRATVFIRCGVRIVMEHTVLDTGVLYPRTINFVNFAKKKFQLRTVYGEF